MTTPAAPVMSDSTASRSAAPANSPVSIRVHALVLALFVFSGACGLIYQVLWCRQLGLLFGNTAYSLSTVLTAFMGGLALGSYIAGRNAHRIQRPFMAYGILEVAIGLYCALIPLFFGENSPLTPFYRSLYGETGSGSLNAVRLLVSFLLLVVPTTFMGATLPLLTHFLARSSGNLGRTVGTLYALNSFGAVVGAAATGFVLLPLLGKIDTNWLAVGMNLLLGLLAIVFGAGERMPQAVAAADAQPLPSAAPSDPDAGSARSDTPLSVKLAIASFGITGFAAMVTQIGWTKAISLGTGSSTYAFSLIVAVFILGLSSGGAWGARKSTQVADPLAALARCLVQIGMLNLIVSLLLGFAPLIFYFLIAWGSQFSWRWVLAGQAFGVAALIALPTFLMGATMPFTMQVVRNLSPDPARTTGTVYAINTLGAILGSALGGLLLIPLLQIQASLEIMALLYAVPGFILFWLAPTRREPKQLRSMVLLAVAFAVMVWFIPPWDKMLMSSGIYLLRDKDRLEAARDGRILDALPQFGSDQHMLYYKEGAEATVAVWTNPFDRSLRVGGKPDATAYGDLHTQVCLTLVPQMLHRTGGKDILVIGLGSGVSVGAALAPEGVERVDVVEMSPEVVEASAYFADVNRLKYRKRANGEQWIDTPRVEVLVNDGRNHLLLTRRQYDIIASEPSNPWMAGVGNLFTREAFQLSKDRLRAGGVMCQWIHNYSLDSSHVLSIVKTFGEVFPHMQMWNSKGGDFLLVGSSDPLALSVPEMRKRMARPGIRNWLERMHYDTEEEFLATAFAHDGLLRLRSNTAILHTDDNMLLEFDAPKTLFGKHTPFRPTSNAIFEHLIDTSALATEDAALFRFKLDRSAAAREHHRMGLISLGDIKEHMRVAAILAPHNYFAIEAQNANDEGEANRLLAGTPPGLAPDAAGAVRLLEGIQRRSSYVRFAPKNLHTARMRAIDEALLRKDPQAAQFQLEALARDLKDPLNVNWAALYRAQIAEQKGDYVKAVEQAQLALNSNGDVRKSAEVLYRSLNALDRKSEALGRLHEVNNYLGNAGKLDVELLLLEAQSLFTLGSDEEAMKLVQLITARSNDPRAYRLECLLLRRKGALTEALLRMHTWCASQPDALEPKMEYVSTLRQFADLKIQEQQDLALDLLRVARRVSVEAAVLHPDANEPWLQMARVCKAISKYDADRSREAQLQARQAVKKLLLHLGGDRTQLPLDVTDLVGE